jgi:hypothetical protein
VAAVPPLHPLAEQGRIALRVTAGRSLLHCH